MQKYIFRGPAAALVWAIWLFAGLNSCRAQPGGSEPAPGFALGNDGSAGLFVGGDPSDDEPGAQPEGSPAMWRHSDGSRFWISGQFNTILQGHPAFHAAYSGENSLRPRGEYKASLVGTLFLGVQATRNRNTELLLDIESSGGRGISQALGLAGFTNLDVVRNPTLGSKPYIARVMVHQIVPLSGEMTEASRGPFSLATRLPVRRLEFRAGKFSAADFFDLNSVGSDSHLQFLNWTVDNNGAYDYAADTRGYTFGAIAEYQDRNWGVRFGEMLMPTVANGTNLEWNLRKAHSENVEFEVRPRLIPRRATVVRVLAYFNHANMGVYRDAVNDFLANKMAAPDITAHPFRTTLKYGFGANVEQELTGQLRVFARWGWNEGRHESYAYTEVDQTLQVGGDYRGDSWGRKYDKAGIVFVSNGISRDHQQYLAAGGKGFLLGDGRLNYDRENILETYYNLHLWRGVFTAPDLQYIVGPGYNHDRGPVVVPALRLHLDF